MTYMCLPFTGPFSFSSLGFSITGEKCFLFRFSELHSNIFVRLYMQLSDSGFNFVLKEHKWESTSFGIKAPSSMALNSCFFLESLTFFLSLLCAVNNHFSACSMLFFSQTCVLRILSSIYLIADKKVLIAN